MRWSDSFFTFFYSFSLSFQAVLVKSREQVADELSRLQRDNESLQGKHRLHVELQQQEDFQMPNTMQVCETQSCLLNSELGNELQNFAANNDVSLSGHNKQVFDLNSDHPQDPIYFIV